MKQLELRQVAEDCACKIKNGYFSDSPFKHLVVDDFLPIRVSSVMP